MMVSSLFLPLESCILLVNASRMALIGASRDLSGLPISLMRPLTLQGNVQPEKGLWLHTGRTQWPACR